MKRAMIITMLMFTIMGIHAAESDSRTVRQRACDDETKLSMPLQPTYLTDLTQSAGWGANWFMEVKGGASAFLGSPIGCGDVFDRMMPTLQVGIGKWFTPSVGGRIGFQGLQLKNADLQTMDYQFVHADFMYNLTHNLQPNESGLSKFDIIPFIGVGMVRNNSTPKDFFLSGGEKCGNHPFAFSYGIEARYRLSDRIHLLGEISGLTTLKNFDCVGTSCKLSDHMLSVSLGLSYTIGKCGWKKVIDARPYIRQNDYLMDRYATLQQQTRVNENTEKTETNNTGSKNEYRGLLSLRQRMAQAEYADTLNQAETADNNDSQEIAVGVPVYFYFKINTAELVDKSQLVNLDEIAKLAKEQNLTIHISGAADSATGSEKTNRRLSKERARYIGKCLMKRGVDKSLLKAVSLGGIDQFTPDDANRFCVVLLEK